MNKTAEYVAAIDIGTTKIVAIVGKKNEKGQIEVMSLDKTVSKGVKRGVVLNIEDTVQAIRKTVEKVKEESGVNFKEVFVGIAGQHIKSMKNRGYLNRDSYEDMITQADIDRLMNDMYRLPVDAGEEIIHVLPQHYVVDNESGVENPVGMSGKRIEGNFHIVIGQISSARNIQKCIERVGLETKSLVLEPLASSAAVLTDDEKEAGVALVDIGGGTTDVAVYHEGIIRHTAVIPFGGNVVTKDIKEGCAILQRQAEALKMQFGSALGDIAPEDKVVTIPGISGREPKEISFRNLAYIIQSRMEEIIDAVFFEIEGSGYSDILSAGIVLTGGGALLRHLPQLVKFKTGLDVRIGFPNEHLAGNVSDEINKPIFATSVGLLMEGFKHYARANESMKMEEVKKAEPVKQVVVEEPVAEKEEELVTPTPQAETHEKKSLFGTIKKTLSDIFDEDGAEM